MARDTLNRELIVKAALDLLDTEGLEGLNMRALGDRLGSAATAVYWHVGSKANLIALAGDHLWRELPLPDPNAIGWRTAATLMAADLQTMFTRHPWVVQAFGSFVVFGPGRARYDDHTLGVYEAAGFTGARAEQAATAVFTYVLGNALGPAAVASLRRKLRGDGRRAKERIRETMADAKEIAKQFPRLRARLETAAAAYGTAPERSFDFGLRAILAGMEAELGPPLGRQRPDGVQVMTSALKRVPRRAPSRRAR